MCAAAMAGSILLAACSQADAPARAAVPMTPDRQRP
jgi:hypothetical protein